eukprot:4759871-Amphidinium_carterae.2
MGMCVNVTSMFFCRVSTLVFKVVTWNGKWREVSIASEAKRNESWPPRDLLTEKSHFPMTDDRDKSFLTQSDLWAVRRRKARVALHRFFEKTSTMQS